MSPLSYIQSSADTSTAFFLFFFFRISTCNNVPTSFHVTKGQSCSTNRVDIHTFVCSSLDLCVAKAILYQKILYAITL
ncbi:hypothetical protein J3Q64DRAFT_1771373 [Phycomyces blakesleeanus]|uniref:Secreted protein n=1 Tax=Phycomyces blakesleeanus TaxID=4837 RepID=A0ABR3ALR9_PHYBL